MPQSTNPRLPPHELAKLHFHGFFEEEDDENALAGPLPEYLDGLMQSARAELAVEQRAAALAADYHNGLRLLDAGRWEEAVAAFERVTRLDSAYQDVAALLGRARRELASATLAEEQARRQAEERARWQVEEQRRRRAKEHDRARQQKEAENWARPVRNQRWDAEYASKRGRSTVVRRAAVIVGVLVLVSILILLLWSK